MDHNSKNEEEPVLSREEAIEELYSWGAPKDVRSESHSSILDYITRASMRHLNDKAIALNQKIKSKLKLFFESRTPEEIEWVLSHGLESRGFFKKLSNHNPSTDQQTLKDDLMHWLNTPQQPEFNSLDISLINGVIASISYAAFDRETDYKNHDISDIKSRCLALMAPAPFVGAYLSERMNAIVRKNSGAGELRLKQQDSLNESYKNQNIIAAQRRMVSFASTSGEFSYITNLPEIEATRRVFQISDDNTFTGVAAETGRLVGHFSANTTSALFMVNELLKLNEQEKCGEIVLSIKEAQLLAGMIAADYHRSAFHSPEEVFLGMMPYIEKIRLIESGLQDITKEDLIQHLAKEIPKHLADAKNNFSDLTKNAITLLSHIAEKHTQESIMFFAEEVSKHPDKQMDPQEEPLLLVDAKKQSPLIFEKSRMVTNTSDNLPMIVEPLEKKEKSIFKRLKGYMQVNKNRSTKK